MMSINKTNLLSIWDLFSHFENFLLPLLSVVNYILHLMCMHCIMSLHLNRKRKVLSLKCNFSFNWCNLLILLFYFDFFKHLTNLLSILIIIIRIFIFEIWFMVTVGLITHSCITVAISSAIRNTLLNCKPF